MYERKTPLDMSCGIRITMCLIGAKWKPCLIDMLRDGAMRPSEIHKNMPEATPRVLNQQLKELEEHGIVKKEIFPVLPPHSEYSLTELGRDLLPIIDMLDDWGESHRANFECTNLD
ncbi:MAG: winged helix-turn-helix transcriptional regulator [Tannerellaceae bacterium]